MRSSHQQMMNNGGITQAHTFVIYYSSVIVCACSVFLHAACCIQPRLFRSDYWTNEHDLPVIFSRLCLVGCKYPHQYQAAMPCISSCHSWHIVTCWMLGTAAIAIFHCAASSSAQGNPCQAPPGGFNEPSIHGVSELVSE
jgi:hypothetical protein